MAGHFTYDVARQYYSPALRETSREQQEPSFMAPGEARPVHPYTSQLGSLSILGAGGVATWGLGFVRLPPIAVGRPSWMGGGKLGLPAGRVFDLYHQAAKFAEETSPGKILRTFQGSQFLSQFTTANQAARTWTPALLDKWGSGALEGVSKASLHDFLGLVGTQLGRPDILSTGGMADIYAQGLHYEAGKLHLGTSSQGRVLASNVSLISSDTESFRLIQSVARSVGLDVPYGEGSKFTSKIPYLTGVSATSGGVQHLEHQALVLAQSRAGQVGRNLSALGAGLVDRFNTLLHGWPGDVPLVGGLLKKVPFLDQKLGVRPGAALPTLGRLALKYGPGLGLAVGA